MDTDQNVGEVWGQHCHYDASFKVMPVTTIKALLRVVGTGFEQRLSSLLLEQLRWGIMTDQVHAQAVMAEILFLEGAGPHCGTVPEKQFTNEALRGYWKKHWHQSSFIAQNVSSHFGLNSDKKSKKLEQVYRSLIKDIPNPFALGTPEKFELSRQIANKILRNSYEMKANNGLLTGEWLVFRKYGGKRYYLSLALHAENEQDIASRIQRNCRPQFPFLFDPTSVDGN
jgi:hypothetical protein